MIRSIIYLLSITLLLISQIAVTEPAKQPDFQPLEWNNLTPELDNKILERYQAGEISNGELREYINTFYSTSQPELNARTVSLTGYLIPQNLTEDGDSTYFALVKKIGAWSHTDNQLKPNQVVIVHYPTGLKLNHSTLERYRVSGVMSVGQYSIPATESFYQIRASTVDINPPRFNEKY